MADATRSHTDWIGRTVYDRSGDKVGSITDIFYDDRTGRPEWLTVSTGWFGTKEQFVPISGSTAYGDDIRVDYDTQLVKDAPSIDTGDAHLSEDEEARLYSHYGFGTEGADVDTLYGDRDRADEGYEYYDRRDAGIDRTDTAVDVDTTDSGQSASTVLHEEEVSVDKTQRTAGRARLHKYVVTEDVNVTVPVKKQVARLVREPIAGETAGGIGDIGETVEEVTLMEEEIDVSKRTVARERVGLEVDEVTEQRQVNETVRKEEIDVEGNVVTTDGLT